MCTFLNVLKKVLSIYLTCIITIFIERFLSSLYLVFQCTVCNNNFQLCNIKMIGCNKREHIIKQTGYKQKQHKGCLFPCTTFQITDYFVFRIFLRNRLSLRTTLHEIMDSSLLIYFYFYSNTSLLLLYIIRMKERRPAYFHLNRDAMRRHAV